MGVRKRGQPILWLAALLVAALLLFVPAEAAAAPPPPSFTASPSQAGQPVTFTTTDTGVGQYIWDFGDGGQSVATNSQTIQHTYARGGVYNVTLTETDPSDGTTSQITQQVGVIGPPNAAFNPTAAVVLVGTQVRFDGTQSSDPDGTITGYGWNFGDGTGSGGPQPTHGYSAPGTYNVSLTVTDNHGGSSTITHQITVLAPAPVQTLVESIIPAPILVKFGSPSILRPGIVDLHWRLFCPGSGPVCRTTIAERSGAAASHFRPAARAGAASVLVTKPNGNAELALRLTSAQWKALGKSRSLSFTLSIVSTRGAEKVTNLLHFKLARKG